MNFIQKILAWFEQHPAIKQQVLLAPESTPIAPKPTPTASITPNLFDTFCEAIKGHEGANPANNNPFNCKYYYGGYLPIYGDVKRSPGGFAMFSTYALGELYGENIVKEIIKNHPNLTFYSFFAGEPAAGWAGYAPASDGNNPENYSTIVATACGKSVDNLVAVIL